VDRVSGETGYCGAGPAMEVASCAVHTGEEPFFTGSAGTGNVFFNHCSMSCVYCQNYQISTCGGGRYYTPDTLAEELLSFQRQGCPTVGFVSPGHYLPLVAETIEIARNRGLTVPAIWNSNGFETVESLQRLEGLIDIYLPDFKYWCEDSSLKYSATPGYPGAARAAVKEMFRQVGPLKLTNGIAESGLCLRHLVLPNDIADTEKILEFVASVSTQITVSLMSQYNPVYRAGEFILLSRKLHLSEYWRAVETVEGSGLENFLFQEPESSPDSYLPDFSRRDVFSE
jgi:putative pyruvate formate lyase activating enzyme